MPLLPRQIYFIRLREHEQRINIRRKKKTSPFVGRNPKKSDSCDAGNDILATCFIHCDMIIQWVLCIIHSESERANRRASEQSSKRTGEQTSNRAFGPTSKRLLWEQRCWIRKNRCFTRESYMPYKNIHIIHVSAMCNKTYLAVNGIINALIYIYFFIYKNANRKFGS